MRRNLKSLNVLMISALLFVAFSPVVALADPTPSTGDDTIIGTENDDNISSLAGDDIIYGQGGNDTLNGNAGNDTLYGEAGDDKLSGGNGNDNLFGGDGVDTVRQTVDNDQTLTDSSLTGRGTDTLDSIENASLNGGDSGNEINASAFTGTTTIKGFGGDDILIGGENDDELYGGDGDDLLYGNGGDDMLFGSDGEDYLEGGTGNDHLGGGADADELYGGEGNDELLGHAGADLLYGEEGDDVLHGGRGNDTLNGGSGDDFLFGEAGSDTINGGDGFDVVFQQIDNDQTLTNTQLTGQGTDSLNSIEGADLTGGSSNNLINAVAFSGEVHLYGEAGNDTLLGGSGNDLIEGGDGDDVISGGAGDDDLYGNAGDDIISGNDGDDFLDGGLGNDELSGGDGFDVVFQQTDNDQTLTDTLLTGQGNDRLYNIEGADLTGGTGNNTIDASLFTGKVHLYGEGGNDTLLGGSNSDLLEGGDGDDYIHGGLGADLISGGAGNDIILDGGYDPTAPNTGLYEVIDAGDGDDTITTSGLTAMLTGWSGNDTYNFTSTDTNTTVIVIDPQGSNLFHFAPGTQGHYYLATVSNEDTLDFSDYDQSVNVDLSNTNDQEVSSGLWLTLSGFFKNIIGTNQDDVLIGNSLDNNISGLGGNDQIDGNGGVNHLDGGPGTDEELNPDPANTRISIEIPSNDDPTPLGFMPPIGLAGVIPVTGGDIQKLQCPVGANEITLQLETGDQVRFIGLCDLEASLDKLGQAGIPAELPGGTTFVSDMLIQVLDEGTLLKLFESGSIELSFVIPPNAQGKDLSLLYWNEDASAWVEIPLDSTDLQYPANLNPDDSGDQRMIYKGLSSTLLKAITQENFSGLFVLVAK
jgi:Ca2+-binding RTX toxin-like protein